MNDRYKPLAVSVVVVLALSITLAGLVVFEGQPGLGLTVAGCPVIQTWFTPPSRLSPQDPVILPKCSAYSFYSGSIAFSITSPVDLNGSWVSSVPLGLCMFNTTPSIFVPPPGGCPGGVKVGYMNLTLFPGTYAIGVRLSNETYQGPIWIVATQALTAVFGRGLDVLQRPEVANLTADNYTAWTLSAPPGATSFHLEGLLSMTGCGFVIAFLPATLFQEFETNRSVIRSPNATLISDVEVTVGCDPTSVTYAGIGSLYPLNLTAGSDLVFWNPWDGSMQLTVLGPIEVSYLTPDQ